MMYGVPADLDLSFLIGGELSQVCIGTYQFQFHFTPTGTISVTARWDLRSETGQLVDTHSGEFDPDRGPFHFQRIIGQRVVAITIAAPQSLTIRFANGLGLTVFDDNPHFESFQIDPGNIIV
ncbi:hypothetical protein ETAA8_18930 [Anatilimnocola aggregata]|uniref:Uncharacterized protein n=1 Tax=Anatilimnocola aggregata TaxID=2528021 RepID=A0A517Y9A5_9BACT|nr:hypothetical protein [Anatilimnocola aggregata]QDU26810.1 hypothetical protein ETAA8_18930 [Anatilimnocola aggregata]